MRSLASRGLVALPPLLAVVVACSGSTSEPAFGTPGPGGTRPTGGADASAGADASGGPISLPPVGGGNDSGSPTSGCTFHDGTDHDGDGFSGNDGDCNDCDPNSNPGAFDVPKNGIDEDCNGVADDEPTGCDAMAQLASTDPFNAALAIDICRKTTESATGKQRTWGITDAKFVAPDGTDSCPDAILGLAGSCVANANFQLGHGNLTRLGSNKPQQGAHMLGLSSGTARDPQDPGYSDVSGFEKAYTSGAAPGFPAPAPACPGVTTGQPYDGAALKIVVRVPTNARSFSFESNFFSFEFPTFICSEYNDAYVVEMTPAPKGAGAGGNVVFDQSGNYASVNNALLQACDAQNAGGKQFACPLGSSSLQATGFGSDGSDGTNHAATGWLQTTVNVDASLKGKDITLLFAAWDSGDGALDSTALVDNFQWSTSPGMDAPITQPTPPPK